MKTGVSLPFSLLCERPANEQQIALMESFGSLRALLDWLADAGISHIELRQASPKEDPVNVVTAVSNCLAAGLQTTIHGKLTETGDFFAPFTALLAADLQPSYTVTVHTVDIARTPALLREARHPRFRLALENNRRREPSHQGMSCEGVRMIAESVGPDQGLCWDWGHYYYNLTRAGVPGLVPDKAFLHRVIHTHIHGVTHTTHYPPTPDNLPMCRYIRALEDVGYQGVYNLELDFPRFSAEMTPREGLELAVSNLREALAHA